MTGTLRAYAACAVIASGCLSPLPAAADDLQRRILGAGAAIILNEMMKNQPRSQPRNQVTPRAGTAQPRASGSRSSGARATNSGGGSSAASAARRMQADLNRLGFDAGPVDGQPGRRTRAAVSAWQQARGFPPTGSLSAPQQTALSADVLRQTGDQTKADALEMQANLNALGYNAGPPDGIWGRRSQAALDRWRGDQGRPGGAPLMASDAEGVHLALYRQPPGPGRAPAGWRWG